MMSHGQDRHVDGLLTNVSTASEHVIVNESSSFRSAGAGHASKLKATCEITLYWFNGFIIITDELFQLCDWLTRRRCVSVLSVTSAAMTVMVSLCRVEEV